MGAADCAAWQMPNLWKYCLHFFWRRRRREGFSFFQRGKLFKWKFKFVNEKNFLCFDWRERTLLEKRFFDDELFNIVFFYWLRRGPTNHFSFAWLCVVHFLHVAIIIFRQNKETYFRPNTNIPWARKRFFKYFAVSFKTAKYSNKYHEMGEFCMTERVVCSLNVN